MKDPANYKPAERIAVKGIAYGNRFVEYSERHGTRVRVVLKKEYGGDVNAILRALADELAWLETGVLPEVL